MPLITENGDTILDVVEGRPYLVLISGNFGAGDLALSYYEDETGDYKPIENAGWGAAAEDTIDICPSRKLKVTLSNAFEPAIVFRLVEGAKL